MKRILISISLLLGIVSFAQAHDQPPITDYVQRSETVCIVKATSIDKKVVTFSVEEVVKGKPPTVLKLEMIEADGPITIDSEWLLASTRAKEDTMGWAAKGDYGWVNAPIMRVNGEPYLVGNYSLIVPAVGTDVSKGMSLEQLKELAKRPPTDDLRSIWLPVSH